MYEIPLRTTFLTMPNGGLRERSPGRTAPRNTRTNNTPVFGAVGPPWRDGSASAGAAGCVKVGSVGASGVGAAGASGAAGVGLCGKLP